MDGRLQGLRPVAGVETDAGGGRWRVTYDGGQTLAEGLVVTSRTVRRAVMPPSWQVCLTKPETTGDRMTRIGFRNWAGSWSGCVGFGGWPLAHKVSAAGSVARSDGRTLALDEACGRRGHGAAVG